MALRAGRWVIGALVSVGLAGCTEGTTGASDAGAAPADCWNFAGSYIPQVFASCSDSKVISVPLGACVSQVGCELTIVTNQTTLKGKVTGDSFSVSGVITTGAQPMEEECTGRRLESGSIDLQCNLKVGGVQQATCALPSDLMADTEGASALCCDYRAQDCGAGQRCTAVNAGNQSSLPVMPTCIAVTGAKKLDEDCARGEVVGLSNIGYDDCEAGLFCSGYSLEAGKSRKCRELCLSATDCPSDRTCLWLGSDVPVSGVCVPSCQVLGNNCAGALTCRRYGALDEHGAVKTMGTCEATGAKALGEACGSGPDCGAGLFCHASARKCVAYCDDQHPCNGGKTCSKFGGEPAGSTLGVCALE